jgi:hypothetical protein
VHRVGQGPLLVLVGLAHIKNRQVIEVRRDLVGGYLTNLGLGSVQ